MTATPTSPIHADLSDGAVVTLSESAYRSAATAVLDRIERTVDRWLEEDLIDIDTHRTGGLLELSLPKGSKIIINLQPPLQEVWMAAQGGGFHYRWQDGQWMDTRSGQEFFTALSDHLSRQAGCALTVSAAPD